jgi:hypothetical protein
LRYNNINGADIGSDGDRTGLPSGGKRPSRQAGSVKFVNEVNDVGLSPVEKRVKEMLLRRVNRCSNRLIFGRHGN